MTDYTNAQNAAKQFGDIAAEKGWTLAWLATQFSYKGTIAKNADKDAIGMLSSAKFAALAGVTDDTVNNYRRAWSFAYTNRAGTTIERTKPAKDITLSPLDFDKLGITSETIPVDVQMPSSVKAWKEANFTPEQFKSANSGQRHVTTADVAAKRAETAAATAKAATAKAAGVQDTGALNTSETDIKPNSVENTLALLTSASRAFEAIPGNKDEWVNQAEINQAVTMLESMQKSLTEALNTLVALVTP